MTFKADVLAAAKLKAEELEDWKFVSKRYQSRPVKFCDLIIDPFWFFYGSPAAAMIQPAVGVYIKEVEVIVSDLSGLPVGKVATFSKKIHRKELGYPLEFTVYVKDFGSQQEAVEQVFYNLGRIFQFGKEYIDEQYCLDTKEKLYLSVPEVARGMRCVHYCVVRGLLGDTDYIKRVLNREIDPEGYQDLELIGKIFDYFS
ncbi:hypothetical protein ACJJIU_04380 [Microbulbifer sp. CnH-101-E]|uniref:hypothetical protein n=1 Tax=unclassified Microbulbifer TaxID=2619833 RepID=UPI0040397873